MIEIKNTLTDIENLVAYVIKNSVQLEIVEKIKQTIVKLHKEIVDDKYCGALTKTAAIMSNLKRICDNYYPYSVSTKPTGEYGYVILFRRIGASLVINTNKNKFDYSVSYKGTVLLSSQTEDDYFNPFVKLPIAKQKTDSYKTNNVFSKYKNDLLYIRFTNTGLPIFNAKFLGTIKRILNGRVSDKTCIDAVEFNKYSNLYGEKSYALIDSLSAVGLLKVIDNRFYVNYSGIEIIIKLLEETGNYGIGSKPADHAAMHLLEDLWINREPRHKKLFSQHHMRYLDVYGNNGRVIADVTELKEARKGRSKLMLTISDYGKRTYSTYIEIYRVMESYVLGSK